MPDERKLFVVKESRYSDSLVVVTVVKETALTFVFTDEQEIYGQAHFGIRTYKGNIKWFDTLWEAANFLETCQHARLIKLAEQRAKIGAVIEVCKILRGEGEENGLHADAEK